MFRFQSFHMYGVIGSAVVVGIVLVQWIKRKELSSMYGERILIPDKQFSIPRYLIGGTIFGLGWALTGACPAPMFILVGNGFLKIGRASCRGRCELWAVHGLLLKNRTECDIMM